MVREARSPDDLAEIVRDCEYIARRVQELRLAMIDQGLETVHIQDGTPKFYLGMVRTWADSLPGVLSRARAERSAMAKRRLMEEAKAKSSKQTRK